MMLGNRRLVQGKFRKDTEFTLGGGEDILPGQTKTNTLNSSLFMATYVESTSIHHFDVDPTSDFTENR